MIVVVCVGSAVDQPIVTTMGGLALVLMVIARLWNRVSLENVAYTRNISSDRLFLDDEFTLTLTIENRKPVPLPWLRSKDFLPTGLEVLDADVRPIVYIRAAELIITTSLAWYERVHIKYRVKAVRRGFYQLGPATIHSGDIFGLYSSRLSHLTMDSVLVYPRIVPMHDFFLPSARPIGDAKTTTPYIDDPSRVKSVRDYRLSDSMRAIDWKSTARRQQLTVRTYDPSASHFAVLIVDMMTTEHPWEGYEPALLERVATGAASIATRSVQIGYRTGLITNAVPLSRISRSVLSADSTPEHLKSILEILGMARPLVTQKLPDLVQSEHAIIPRGATIVVISSLFTTAVKNMTEDLAHQGHPTVAIYVGSKAQPVMSHRVEIRDMATSFNDDDSLFFESNHNQREQNFG